MRLQLQWDGTAVELIELCDELAKDGTDIGLDSLDLGDAMGFILTETMMEGGEWTIRSGNHILQATIEYDAFDWEIPEGMPTMID